MDVDMDVEVAEDVAEKNIHSGNIFTPRCQLESAGVERGDAYLF